MIFLIGKLSNLSAGFSSINFGRDDKLISCGRWIQGRRTKFNFVFQFDCHLSEAHRYPTRPVVGLCYFARRKVWNVWRNVTCFSAKAFPDSHVLSKKSFSSIAWLFGVRNIEQCEKRFLILPQTMLHSEVAFARQSFTFESQHWIQVHLRGPLSHFRSVCFHLWLCN